MASVAALMVPAEDDLEQLVSRAAAGDEAARERLWSVYRERLRLAVSLRMDRRLVSRLDPSDVVQEALLYASSVLPEFLQARSQSFYVWLRQIALERLIDSHRRHLADKRSVLREEPIHWAPQESVADLANFLVTTGTTPSANLQRDERRAQVQTALAQLADKDRELLVLRYLENLPLADIAAVMQVTEAAVRVRHLRALQRLRKLLPDTLEGPAP